MEISEKIRTFRKEAGMSQEELADRIGVSRQAVTKWETSAGHPDLYNIKEQEGMKTCCMYDITPVEMRT